MATCFTASKLAEGTAPLALSSVFIHQPAACPFENNASFGGAFPRCEAILISGKRGLHKNLSYVEDRALISFEAPLANLLTDFYDQLKSLTSGYGSFNYELDGYRAGDLVRVKVTAADGYDLAARAIGPGR